jgi:hypothetical protein
MRETWLFDPRQLGPKDDGDWRKIIVAFGVKWNPLENYRLYLGCLGELDSPEDGH